MQNIFNNKATKTILGGIIVYLFCELLVRPIIGIVRNYSGNLWDAIVDYYFQSCAQADIIIPLIFIITLTSCIILLTPIVNGIFQFKSITKINKKIKKLESEINSAVNGTELTPKSIVEEVSEKPVTAQSVQLELKKLKTNIRLATLLNFLSMAINFMVFINIIFFQIIPVAHKSVFERYIILITPYTESLQIETLKSDWLRMNTKNDYNKINEVILRIVEDNQLR